MRKILAVVVYVFFFVAAVRDVFRHARLKQLCRRIQADTVQTTAVALGFEVTLPDRKLYICSGTMRIFKTYRNVSMESYIVGRIESTLRGMSDNRIEVTLNHFDNGPDLSYMNYWYIFVDCQTWLLVKDMDEANRMLDQYPSIIRYMAAAKSEFLSLPGIIP